MSQPRVFQPTTPDELSRFLAENAAGNQDPILPVGGRTALRFGYPPPADALTVSLTKLSRTIDYPARDMTITVEAGVRIDALNELLRSERQQLPVDVSQSNRATLGGVVVTNTSGPRRFGYGTMRDYVIGVTAVDAQGKTFHAGGRVVKNVAGYDFCKLLVGSMGTLAVVTQLTLKLKPLPQDFRFLWSAHANWKSIETVLESLLQSESRPVVLDVFDPQAAQLCVAESRLDLPTDRPVLVIGIDGTEQETDWQIEILKRELQKTVTAESIETETVRGESAQRLLHAMTEFPIGSDGPLTFQASVPPSAVIAFAERAQRDGVTVGIHAGNGIVNGHLSDESSTVEQAESVLQPLREFVLQHRGSLTILDCDDVWKERLGVFAGAEASRTLMRRVKSAMDPHGLLNPGRFLDRADLPLTG